MVNANIGVKMLAKAVVTGVCFDDRGVARLAEDPKLWLVGAHMISIRMGRRCFLCRPCHLTSCIRTLGCSASVGQTVTNPTLGNTFRASSGWPCAQVGQGARRGHRTR